MRRLILPALLAPVLGWALPHAAYAHAHLEQSSPAATAHLTAPPIEVSLEFSEALEPDFSTIEVRDAAGHRVDNGKAHADPQDPKHLAVALKPLGPGTYSVVWRVTSVDTHKTHGSYRFTLTP